MMVTKAMVIIIDVLVTMNANDVAKGTYLASVMDLIIGIVCHISHVSLGLLCNFDEKLKLNSIKLLTIEATFSFY